MSVVTKLATATDATINMRRYVRVTNVDHHGFVEFQFSVDDPNLYLEMTLPKSAFDEFCREHNAHHLTEAQAALVDETEKKWRFGDDVV